MAKLPKKIDQEIKPLDLRQFVSSAAQKPASASAVTRINLTRQMMISIQRRSSRTSTVQAVLRLSGQHWLRYVWYQQKNAGCCLMI